MISVLFSFPGQDKQKPHRALLGPLFLSHTGKGNNNTASLFLQCLIVSRICLRRQVIIYYIFRDYISQVGVLDLPRPGSSSSWMCQEYFHREVSRMYHDKISTQLPRNFIWPLSMWRSTTSTLSFFRCPSSSLCPLGICILLWWISLCDSGTCLARCSSSWMCLPRQVRVIQEPLITYKLAALRVCLLSL